MGRFGRLPPCASRGDGRCETRAGHLACGSRRATEPTETSGGDVASRVVWVAAARPRHRTGRLPSGGLRTPWLLSTGWSYHFLGGDLIRDAGRREVVVDVSRVREQQHQQERSGRAGGWFCGYL